MRHSRFFVALALIAAGCALLICSYEPRPATAVWVGSGVHEASLRDQPCGDTTTDGNAS